MSFTVQYLVLYYRWHTKVDIKQIGKKTHDCRRWEMAELKDRQQ